MTEQFKSRAYTCAEAAGSRGLLERLESHLVMFQKVYDRLDIKILERGESFYQDMMVNVVADLIEDML